MCVFFHSWERWKQPVSMKMTVLEHGRVIETYTALVQERVCQDCGKMEKREVLAGGKS